MYRETSKLVIYRNLDADNLLFPMADICEKFYTGNYQKEQLITSIYEQIHKLLDVATVCGFDTNLWHNYLTYILVSCVCLP